MTTLVVPLQPLALRHEIGDVIKDRYSIREVLGGGAFGTVYRVEESIGTRTVTLACKEMHVLDDPATQANERDDALRMFQEEAYLLQTLRNVHIPAAYFESAKGVWLACPVCGRVFRGTRVCPEHGSVLQVVKERYYLIMDFIEGLDLEQKLLANGSRPLDELQVIDWALQVCDALATVHAKGFSHRDIKPANIKIQNDSGEAMLIDFGLVKPSTVVGGYGTVLKRTSTGLGTIGYAPPSAQEQAQPDARTDILALGMTLYRLLTGRDPTDPQDLELMRRQTPRNFNSSLSTMIDAIIMKATQTDPNKRYPDVASLRADLRAARYPVETTCPNCGWVQHTAHMPDAQTLCERCGRPLMAGRNGTIPAQKAATPRPAVSPVTQVNPYQKRILEIREELKNPTASPTSQIDARVRTINDRLSPLYNFSVNPPDLCPGCHQARLTTAAGQPTGLCPLCQQGQLMRRQWELKHCPICRKEGFAQQKLSETLVMCPICRRGPVEEERRPRFGGMVVDVWWHCPRCQAHFDEHRGRALLVSFEDDPYGIGAQQKGQSHTRDEWQKISTRSERYGLCPHCSAQFDVPDDDRMTLMDYQLDPFEVGKRYKGTTASWAAWARLSRDLPPIAGTHHCSHCRAEYDYDRVQHTMTLLEAANIPAWAQRWRGMPISLQSWYFAAEGKRSGNPGLICPSCHTEFDQDGNSLKLAATTASALTPSLNQSLSLEDWQRRARGIPTLEEAQQLRNELARLQAQKNEEQVQFRRDEQRRLAQLEEEMFQLYKQAVLGGFTPLRRMSPAASAHDWKHMPGSFVVLPLNIVHSALRSNEELRWESTANKCSVQTIQGACLWSRDASGVLVVTSERIMFVSQTEKQRNMMWQCENYQISAVDIQAVQGSSVIVLHLVNNTLIGFEMGIAKWDLVMDGSTHTLTMTPEDLVTLLKSLSG
ncbi:MAG: protein kinase [Abitibacteriaceae bacterium]|nr:protein kinase [Abditibacteriaceae bacterium]